VVEVPADDLDAAFATMRAKITELAPHHRLVADYTGGTKTMTAALVLAALESEDTELQLVTGARADLVKVQSGMEQVTGASVAAIRLRRAMAPYRAAWQRFAYGEAAAGLARLRPPPGRGDLSGELAIARDVSRALDAWDRFDHDAALGVLDHYRPRLGRHLGALLTSLGILAGRDRDPDRRSALRLHDLWLNAQRRAVQGRYDDAVARGYRLLEWTAQWLLQRHGGIDTSDVPVDRIPGGITLTPNREGKYQAGLFAAWDLVGTLVEGPAAVFARGERERLQDHIRVRNHSILAHGFAPIGEDGWRTFGGWLEAALLPVLETEARAVGIRQMPGQLPTDWVWVEDRS